MNSTQLVKYRNIFREKVIPSYYSGPAHIAFFTLTMLALTGYFISRITLFWHTPFIILGTIIYASFALYWIHVFLLHRKIPLFGWAYKLHHLHHTFYTHKKIQFDQINDIYMLLMPPWLQGIYFLLYMPVVCYIGSLIFGMNTVYIIALALSFWYFFYEVVHFISHLNKDHFAMRFPFFAFMRRHHRMHHHELHKNVCNFGIVEPTMDYIFRSKL